MKDFKSLNSAVLRGVLSVFIVYHLLCVLLYPVFDQPSTQGLVRWMRPYLHFFEMTNGWNFFAPNPAPPLFIEYELVDGEGKEIQGGRWPEQREAFFLRERQTRRISSTDFMMAAEFRTEKMMVPYLCHQDPKTHSVRLWRVMYTVPTPKDVLEGKRTLGDNVGIERKFVSHNFCDAWGGK